MFKFKCSKCGHDELEEIVCDVTMTYPVVNFEVIDGEIIPSEYREGKSESSEGYIDRYQCSNCGVEVNPEDCEEV